MSENAQKPRIRFKGFSDAWEQRKVSELFRVTRGYVLAASQTGATKTDEKPYPVYSSQTKDKGLMGYYKDYLYEDAITWTTDGANAGTVNYRAGKFYCTNVCGVLLSDKIMASQMIAEALNNVAKGYVSYVGNPKLMNNVMADISIMIPVSPLEQNIISEMFAKLDNLITLHQCESCKKVVAVQSAFARKNLSKWADSWEQRKLGEVSESYSGGTPSVGVKEYYRGQIPFIRSAEINSETTELFLTEEGLKNSSARLVDVGDILYALYGATSGEVGRARLKGAINQAILAIKPHTDYDSEYLAQWLRKSKRSIIETYLQGGQGNLSGAIVKELSVDFPSLKEQKTIGDFFRHLDNLITLHQCKVFSKNIISKNIKIGGLGTENNTSWEQCKLGNIAAKVTEKNTQNSIKETFTNSAEMGVVSQRDFFDHDIAKADKIDGYYIVQENDFIYNPRISVTAPCGPINRNKLGRKGVMSPLYTVFRTNDINPLFLEWYFKSSCWYAYMYFNGDSGARSDRFSIKNELFFDMPIPLPKEDEQRRIGLLLESLNNLITLHQRIKIFITGDYHDQKNK